MELQKYAELLEAQLHVALTELERTRAAAWRLCIVVRRHEGSVAPALVGSTPLSEAITRVEGHVDNSARCGACDDRLDEHARSWCSRCQWRGAPPETTNHLFVAKGARA